MKQIEIDFTSRTIQSLGGEETLTDKDMLELGAGVRRIYEMMKDGQWYSRDEIDKAAGRHGYPAKEGTRRLRELRRWFTIEKVKANNRHWHYRLVVEKGALAA